MDFEVDAGDLIVCYYIIIIIILTGIKVQSFQFHVNWIPILELWWYYLYFYQLVISVAVGLCWVSCQCSGVQCQSLRMWYNIKSYKLIGYSIHSAKVEDRGNAAYDDQYSKSFFLKKASNPSHSWFIGVRSATSSSSLYLAYHNTVDNNHHYINYILILQRNAIQRFEKCTITNYNLRYLYF